MSNLGTVRLIGLTLIPCLATLGTSYSQQLKIPLDKRPEWVAKEGVVLAWSMEPLLFRVRRDGSPGYIPTPKQRAAYLSEYSPEMLAKLKSLGVTLVMLHCYKGAGVEAERESMAEAVEFAKRIHKAGMHVAIYNYSGAFLWELLFKEKPEAKDWVQLDPQGKPVPYGQATYRYYWNRNHPQAVEYYKKIVRFAVEDIGADLIHFDNYSSNTCYDPTSVRHFREYLRNTFTPQQLCKAGIKDVDTVHAPDADKKDTLLHRAWLDFSCKSLATSYHDMVRYAHSLRKDVLVECNPMGIHSRIRPPVDHGRLLQAGEAYWDESMNVGMAGGSLQTRIRFYKIARRNDNMGFNYTTTPLEMAESMAFNLDCVGAILEFEYGEIHDRRNRPITKISPYVDFFRKRRDLLRDAAVIADVAVLRSFPSLVFDKSKYPLATHAVEGQLIANRACFQIIYNDQLNELDRYRALVLAGCSAMSDEHVDAIRRYVHRGGTVCVQGPLATHNEWMMPREKPVLADLP
ncbi:MAG: hypothetical protein JXM70_20905, partial [Pirellulales bacterium]|nr:hypothetical protein [Pirellulales bacterium]